MLRHASAGLLVVVGAGAFAGTPARAQDPASFYEENCTFGDYPAPAVAVVAGGLRLEDSEESNPFQGVPGGPGN